MNETIETIEKVEAKSKKHTSWGYLIAMILVGILAFTSWFVEIQVKEHLRKQVKPLDLSVSATTVEQPNEKEIQEKLTRLLQEEKSKYDQKNSQLMVQFESKLQEISNRNFSAAEREIPGVIHDLTGFSTCNKLCYKLAKDKIKKTHDAETAIQNVVLRSIKHCATSASETDELLNQLKLQLTENSNEFRSSVAATLHLPEFKSLNDAVQERMKEDLFEKTAAGQEIVYHRLSASIGIAIEAICIRSTIRVMTTLLAKATAKVVGSASTAGILAIADGPLPIGDAIGGILGIIGIGSAAKDIYQAQKVLPDELSKSMYDSIKHYRSEIEENARTEAREMLQKYNATNVELMAEYTQNI